MNDFDLGESNEECSDEQNTHIWCVAFSQSKNIYDVDLISNRDKLDKIFPNYSSSWIIVKTFASQQEANDFVESKL